MIFAFVGCSPNVALRFREGSGKCILAALHMQALIITSGKLTPGKSFDFQKRSAWIDRGSHVANKRFAKGQLPTRVFISSLRDPGIANEFKLP